MTPGLFQRVRTKYGQRVHLLLDSDGRRTFCGVTPGGEMALSIDHHDCRTCKHFSGWTKEPISPYEEHTQGACAWQPPLPLPAAYQRCELNRHTSALGDRVVVDHWTRRDVTLTGCQCWEGE